jgi:hypothetical protein
MDRHNQVLQPFWRVNVSCCAMLSIPKKIYVHKGLSLWKSRGSQISKNLP